MQYHAIPCNTMQYPAIPCIIINCWRSVPLPCGQYIAIFIFGEVNCGLLRRSQRCLWGLDISDMTVLSWHTHQQFFRSLKKLLICTCYQKSVSEHKTYFDLVRRINTNLVTSGSFISMHISPILGASIVLIPTIIEQIKWGEYKM